MDTAIFDFDNTILRGDSFAAFHVDCVLSAPWRVPLMLAALPLAGLGALRSQRRGLSVLVWAATVGMSERHLDQRMDRFVLRRFAGGARVHAAALEVIAEHLARGDRVVIATGCEERLATKICAYLGLAQVQVVGTELSGVSLPVLGLPLGRRAVVHCVGPMKVEQLRKRLDLDRWQVAYSDSARDLPLLRVASRRVLVNPTRGSLSRVRRELGGAVAVVRWRRGRGGGVDNPGSM